jgi:hemolysin activation/secretion protein
LGGAAFGRGYGSAEISGDNGMAGSLESRFDGKQNFEYLTVYQLYGFVEAGTAWNDGYSYTDGLALTSAGAGVRLFLSDDLRADLAAAAPLGYSRARQHHAQCTCAVFAVELIQAWPGKSASALPVSRSDPGTSAPTIIRDGFGRNPPVPDNLPLC